jgi:hypothetical protein
MPITGSNNFEEIRGSGKLGQPSSSITPTFAILLLAGVLEDGDG